jgi:hypothetical protein
VTVYQKRIQDLLLQAFVSPSRFYSQQWFNGGEFTNQGIELSLSATPIQIPRGLTWVSTTSFYRNYSVVNSLPVSAFSFGNTFSTGTAYLQAGRSVSQIVNPNVLGAGNQPVQVGDFQPSFVMDFSEEFTYRGFRLSGVLDWHRGGNTINLTELYFDAGPGLQQDVAAGTARLTAFNNGLAPYVDVGTFLKLRELSLSYAVPDHWISWIAHGRVSSARLALTGRNLWSSFRYNGLDPEVSVFGNQNVTTSQDVTPYPPARSVFLSLDVAF